MRKSFYYIILGVFCLGFMSSNSFAQYTAPETVLSFHIQGNTATNEGYGVGSALYGGNFSGATYGMKYGRGVGVDFAIGLGNTKRNRITLGAEWNSMINANQGDIPFFTISPDKDATFYNIYSFEVGYQYCFNARCRQKQTVGIGVSANIINAPDYSVVNFESATRGGIFVQTGYEFVLNAAGTTGLSIGAKYHIVNAFFNANGPNNTPHINDGSGLPGAGYNRYMGLLSVNVALNLYGGVKSLTSLMP